MRRAQHDGCGAGKEDPIASTHDCLFVKGITKSEARCEVVAVAHGRRRTQTNSGQSGARIIYFGRRQFLIVVTQAEIQSQLRIHTPVVLSKKAVLAEVWM